MTLKTKSDLAMAALFMLAIAAVSGVAQENGAAKSSAITPQGKHFVITYAAPSPSEKGESVPKKPASVLEAVGEGIAAKLVSQGLVRVQKLDIQCCNVQLTLLDGGPTGENSKSRETPVSVRVSVHDVDNQPLYTNEYSGSKTGKDAADRLVQMVLADPKMARVLQGS